MFRQPLDDETKPGPDETGPNKACAGARTARDEVGTDGGRADETRRRSIARACPGDRGTRAPHGAADRSRADDALAPRFARSRARSDILGMRGRDERYARRMAPTFTERI